MTSYLCNACNKKYTSYQSLWNHTKKFHNDKELYNNSNNNIDINKNIKYIQKSSVQSLQCIYCKKFYKNSSSKCVHIKSCRLKFPNVQIINNRDNCRYCNTKFNCIMSVNRHEKICNQKQITTINNTKTNII